MVINISVQQYNGGLLPDIILLTQGYYQWGTRLNTMYLAVALYLGASPKRGTPPYFCAKKGHTEKKIK